jgi:hypothetical protein
VVRAKACSTLVWCERGDACQGAQHSGVVRAAGVVRANCQGAEHWCGASGVVPAKARRENRLKQLHKTNSTHYTVALPSNRVSIA